LFQTIQQLSNRCMRHLPLLLFVAPGAIERS
jgi:hypothetical protein